MGSLAKEIRQLLEENDVCEESEELDIDEIVGWAMEDDDCEEMDEGCGSKHKSDDDDDDDDDEMDEDVWGISEEKMKNMAGLSFEIIDMRGKKGFPEDDKGLVYAHRTNEPLKDKYTGIAKNWKRTFAIRTDASGRKGWRVDLMGSFGGPAEAIEGLRGYYKTPMAAAKKLAAYLKSVYQKGVYLESMDVDGGSEELDEAQNAMKMHANRLAKMTDDNEHSEALVYLASQVLKNKKMAKMAKAVADIQDALGYLTPELSKFSYEEIHKPMMSLAKRKLSPEDYQMISGAL